MIDSTEARVRLYSVEHCIQRIDDINKTKIQITNVIENEMNEISESIHHIMSHFGKIITNMRRIQSVSILNTQLNTEAEFAENKRKYHEKILK